MSNKIVWVLAWESEHAGGFDWYTDRDKALKAFHAETLDPGAALFLFPFVTEANETADETTEAIDSDLANCCALAAMRRVSPEALSYWREHGFNMGDATNPRKD